ncbi:MAG: NAD-dependent epimerase/dehydratase family protein [Devosiaceae bacterium]|nr:NAD-dependent epimerase/dehydratase family protein [Devosiaceae bacterium]
MESKIIVITGITGFIAKHVAAQLLDLGFVVRGTLRNPDKKQQVRQAISLMCSEQALERLQLVNCDLLHDEGWQEAMDGAEALMHLAAYVPAREPKDPEAVIRPSLEGTERVFGFARAARIKRIIMTSSIAAIGYGHDIKSKSVHFSVDDWTNVDGLKGALAYAKAKVLAEKKAWELARNNHLDLTCICPSMVFGPAPDTDISASMKIVLRLMNRQVPAIPPGGLSVVDVRDVAKIHVGALGDDDTIDQRIIASAQYIKFTEIADILRSEFPNIKFPNNVAPIWLLKFIGLFSQTIKQVVADLDVVRNYDGVAGEKLLNGKYRDGVEATLSAAHSLIKLGMIKGIKP